MPSTQQKLKVIKEIDERLEYETRQALLDEIKEVTPKTGTESTSEGFKAETIYSEQIKLDERRRREDAVNRRQIEISTDEPDSVEKFPFLNSQKVHDAFRPKIFDPSLRPPQTLTVSEVDKKPMVGTDESQQKV
ncbi:hypothetical protein CEXT_439931 [Caerostris extrusa]|uniref:Uncharacterized protein n=1 Tax=Caerostris extrusa TaxID=172846 RepID=A0AAV4N569_CAEEX|nr:hypothetical protein CEXT_439931 [Caerostris extrusa]